MIATNMTPQVACILPAQAPRAASPSVTPKKTKADDLYDLIIYEFDENALPSRIARFLGEMDCRVIRKDVTTMHLFSGVDSFKAVLTLDLSHCDLARVRQWYDSYSQMVDADLIPHHANKKVRA